MTNVGLNRRINGGPVTGSGTAGNWQENGPTYIVSSWDGIAIRQINMASFTDGTSNTAIFSEWVKHRHSPAKNGLGLVYNFPNSATASTYPTDVQYLRPARSTSPLPGQLVLEG